MCHCDSIKRVPCQENIQTITCHCEKINRKAGTVIFDLASKKCQLFNLYPGYYDGQTLNIQVKRSFHFIVRNINQYEQFYELHFRGIGQTATLTWNKCSGWAIVSTLNSPKIRTLAKQRPSYIYVLCTRRGTISQHLPDFIAVIDVKPSSYSYGKIVETIDTGISDELHHGHIYTQGNNKTYIIAPGLSGNVINVVDATNERHPTLIKRIPEEEVHSKTGLSTLHTTHNFHNGDLLISALSDTNGGKAAGFIELSSDFNTLTTRMSYDGLNYDFNMKECLKTFISSEWSYYNVFDPGFNPADVEAGKYGHRLRFWNYFDNTLTHEIDLRDNPNVPNGGEIPLEVRFLRGDAEQLAYVGCTLSGTIIAIYPDKCGKWEVKEVIHVPNVKVGSQDVIAAITDITISEDDRYLYFSNWLHGDLRQYDITDRLNPKLVGQIWLGGIIGKPIPTINGKYLNGGPQMLRLTADGETIYVTNSLYSTWDDQFYNTPKNNINKNGSWLVCVRTGAKSGVKECDMYIDKDVFIDFENVGGGVSRSHEVHIKGISH